MAISQFDQSSKPLFLVFAGVLTVFALSMAAVFSLLPADRIAGAGDRVAIVGALFSALAFGGLIVAVLLQRQELRLQRQELAMTRDELAGQKAQLAAQNATMSRELFESCLFQLLRLNREGVEAMSAMFPGSHNLVVGAHAFRQAAAHLVEGGHFEFSPPIDSKQRAQLIAADFNQYCLSPTCDFGHYFRNLYHVFSFIERSDLPEEVKSQYARIVRAQLSTAEQILLFANAQTEVGSAFTKFINKYALFRRAQWPNAWSRHRELFPPEAYGEGPGDHTA